MHNQKIKSEKGNEGFKAEHDNMDIDQDDLDIFNANGNLQNSHIKNNQNDIDEESNEEEITDKDSWKVIRAYFNQHGLISQQLGSFNQFIDKNIQEIIDENKTITIDPDINYFNRNISTHIVYELNFGQSHIAAHPQFLENNSSTEHKIFPNEARVRNLDYLSELSVDINFKEKMYNKETDECKIINDYDLCKQNIGKIPIMVRSKYCSLNDKNDDGRIEVKECEFDQGGYFIIGGGEKVIVAQERMATNFVYVFKKKDQSGYTWQAEIRSSIDGTNRPPVQFSVKISKKNVQLKNDLGGLITARIPYVKTDIPIVILFRALGIESDKDIFSYPVSVSNRLKS